MFIVVFNLLWDLTKKKKFTNEDFRERVMGYFFVFFCNFFSNEDQFFSRDILTMRQVVVFLRKLAFYSFPVQSIHH